MAVVSKSRASAALAALATSGLTVATAVAVPPPPNSSFSGQTNQTKASDHGVTLATDANGHVSTMSLGWRAKCRKKGIFWTANTQVNGGSNGLAQNGDVFSDNGGYTGHAGRGITGIITVALHGQFTDSDHANGIWKAKVTVKKKGKTIDKCKTPAIKWSVARR